MTHDELLTKIDEEGEFLVQHFDSNPVVHSRWHLSTVLNQFLPYLYLLTVR